MTSPGYGDPRALRQAVTDRLRALASEREGAQLADLQRQFAYDRLLCRVFRADRDGWVLKGATAMLARLEGQARHTVDVDLYWRSGELGDAAAGAGWRAGYARVARDSPGLEERDLQAALATVGRFIDPVLVRVAKGQWDPQRLGWVSVAG